MRPFLRDLLLFVAIQLGIVLGLQAAVARNSQSYLASTVDKQRLLATASAPRVVFVGGSNLAYGLDSGAVDRALPHEVVNMGLNSFLGVRYLLAEVENEMRAGDIVALSFEHELFFTAPDNDFVDGSPIEQLMLIKAMPSSVKYLKNWRQRVAVLKAVPSVVQIKLERHTDGVSDCQQMQHEIGGATECDGNGDRVLECLAREDL